MSDRNVTPITFLPLEQIALAFAARRTGPKRYRARCPSCGGRSFKVSICAGNDGRSTLLYSFGQDAPAHNREFLGKSMSTSAIIHALRQFASDGCDKVLRISVRTQHQPRCHLWAIVGW